MSDQIQQLRLTFTNALVYTVCAETVQRTIDASNTSSLIVLVVLFAIVIHLMTKLRTYIIAYQKTMHVSQTNIIGVANFLTALVLNVVVQFESTLVARLAVFVLSPSSSHPSWMTGYVSLTLVMLWLLQQSTLAVSPV